MEYQVSLNKVIISLQKVPSKTSCTRSFLLKEKLLINKIKQKYKTISYVIPIVEICSYPTFTWKDQLKNNKIILNKINQIAKQNKVLLNPTFDVVDLTKIKNIQKKLKIKL